MDVWTPTIEDLLEQEHNYYYKKFLDKKITWENWEQIKHNIFQIKVLLNQIKEYKK